MKKITAIVLAALLLVVCVAVSVSAAQESAVIEKDTVLKATATVDGNLDPAYLQSMKVKINPPKYAGAETNVKATVYALYDDKFVYVFYQVENDTTLMSADPDYIADHPHPSLNDAVELRIGDDLEEKLPEYTGSNAAHHLFIMDAYGKRFSCYEDAMEDYIDYQKGAAKIVSATAYNIEMAIPLVNPFNEGDIIQFNFQVDDLQDDVGTTGYIGLGDTYMALEDFTIGGLAPGGTVDNTITHEKQPEAPAVEPEAPAVEPEKPAVEPEKPAVEPEKPAVEPEKPAVEPEAPAVEPEAPAEEPEAPAEDPEAPAEDPEAPAEDPEAPAEDPEAPAEEPEAPAEEPEAPAEEPEAPAEDPEAPAEEPEAPAVEEEKSNTGLIIGIIVAVVVVAAIVVVVLKKKK